VPEGTKSDLAKAYKKWLSNDVAYIITKEEKKGFANGTATGSGTGSGSGSGISTLPINGRQISQLSTMSPGAATATVEVTSSEPTIDTTSSSITTIMRPDENGNFRVVSGGGGGGGGRTSSGSKKNKSPSGKGQGSGSGVGGGSGQGSGSGSGMGSGGGAAPATVEKPQPMTPEQVREAQLKEKLHAWLYAVVTRLAKGDAQPAANEALFVRDGKAEVRIVLTGPSAEVLERLKAAGFEIGSDNGKTEITGRISLRQLAALAEIDEVKLILPRI
jgi:hypothetical protein